MPGRYLEWAPLTGRTDSGVLVQWESLTDEETDIQDLTAFEIAERVAQRTGFNVLGIFPLDTVRSAMKMSAAELEGVELCLAIEPKPGERQSFIAIRPRR